MAAQAGLCLARSETPEDTFCRVMAHLLTDPRIIFSFIITNICRKKKKAKKKKKQKKKKAQLLLNTASSRVYDKTTNLIVGTVCSMRRSLGAEFWRGVLSGDKF